MALSNASGAMPASSPQLSVGRQRPASSRSEIGSRLAPKPPSSAVGLRPPSNSGSAVSMRTASKASAQVPGAARNSMPAVWAIPHSGSLGAGALLKPPGTAASEVMLGSPAKAGNSRAASLAPSSAESARTGVGPRSVASSSRPSGTASANKSASAVASHAPSNAPSASSFAPSKTSSPVRSVRSGHGASGQKSEDTNSGLIKAILVEELPSEIETDRGNNSATDDEEHDIFAPTDERVQTIDFSRIRTQSIQLTKNEQKKKTNVFESMKKQFKNFFHEDRGGQVTDEQGNVELPMDPCVQSREDHDSGLLPSEKLFRLARFEQLQLRDRNLQHQNPRVRHAQGESVDDYEFAWIVKKVSQSVAPSVVDDLRSRVDHRSAAGMDATDGMAPQGDKDKSEKGGDEEEMAQRTTGNTYRSKVGTNTVDFQERINSFLQPHKQGSVGMRAEHQRETEQEKARKAQLLSLCGLVGDPKLEVLSDEERKMLEEFLMERKQDEVDGADGRFPCDCCGQQSASGVDTKHRAATYYDLLFAHRKNDSFSARFDLVHCLPRFVLHYKFHKQLYDCLDESECVDLVKAAIDITVSYSISHCTMQIPFGKYRTNAYPSFFAYIIVPDHTRYLELFEVCNPPAKPGERQRKNSCVIPNWPDKSYVTEFWTYSKESTSTSDKDPRLTSNLYEKNVLKKLENVQMPELMVTRKNPPPELALAKRKLRPHRGDFDLFEDFALVPHQEHPMLGFGSVNHPSHAKDDRSSQPDIEFLDRLCRAMYTYVRLKINTRQRRQAGREDLSCTVNLSLHHSYAFKGHQRVYGFIGFPRGSTYWTALVEEQLRNAELAEAAVTQEDIRRMRMASLSTEGAAAAQSDADDAGTETSADRTEVEEATETLQEKFKDCKFL